MPNYFDVVTSARKNVGEDKLSVLVLGSTFENCQNPYPTRDLVQHLRNMGYDAALVEQNKEGDEHYPMNLPIKMIEMANKSDIILMLVSSLGGTATELPYITALFPDRATFFVRNGDELGGMVEAHLSSGHIVKHKYDGKDDLFVQAERCLTACKLHKRLKETLKKQLEKAN